MIDKNGNDYTNNKEISMMEFDANLEPVRVNVECLPEQRKQLLALVTALPTTLKMLETHQAFQQSYSNKITKLFGHPGLIVGVETETNPDYPNVDIFVLSMKHPNGDYVLAIDVPAKEVGDE